MALPDPINIRIPERLRSDIQAAAKEAGRTLNAEIRMRLQWSIGRFNGEASSDMLANEVESLRGELRGSIRNLNETIKALEAEVDALKKRIP